MKSKNTLYTGKGDAGTTTLYHCDQGRISKSASIIEALGSTDELNSYLGILKVLSNEEYLKINSGKKKILYRDVIDSIQQNLFIIQAEIAGSKISVGKFDIKKLENIIQIIGEVLPLITSFTVSGGSLLSASFDYSRTLARKCERRVVAIGEEGFSNISIHTIAYLNRLSSVLFALSRHTNYLFSIKEEHPLYNNKK